MDKAAAMHARLIEQVSMMLRRAGMYATHDQDFEVLSLLRLCDLRFLDGLPEPSKDDLGLSDKYRSCGIPGPFREAFGDERCYYNEVASVFAEIFHHYGYLVADRLVPDDEWTALLAAAEAAYTEWDARLGEIVEAFGPPSFKIGKWLLCYAPENGTGWVFFDGFEYIPDVNGVSQTPFPGYPDDPILRSIRLPGPDFEAGLRLTPRGKALQRRVRMEQLA
ncbi:hypothetical protein [Glycomyces niveus]|uniref:Uncharacterized protein n=1 Tax=Glycomyces niveus TaxID=2820287 RepID=A0ABS3U6H0_9ACTN|nr:hypothetical protein [Glycomyces sp. NEAU-S30]MBO3734051.1 hypothetical protein [Glycomyces sp. NEAU-S30]